MKAYLCAVALATVLVIGLGSKANADQDHPTVRAVHHYARRKAANVHYAAHHVRARYHHWKARKGHNVRAWLNNH